MCVSLKDDAISNKCVAEKIKKLIFFSEITRKKILQNRLQPLTGKLQAGNTISDLIEIDILKEL